MQFMFDFKNHVIKSCCQYNINVTLSTAAFIYIQMKLHVPCLSDLI